MTRNKRGEGMLYPCILIVTLSLFVSVLIMFVNTTEVIAGTRRLNRTILDSFVTTNAITIYDSIKNGTDDIAELPTQDLISEIFLRSKFALENGMYYSYNEDGSERYHITVPTLEFIEAGSLKVRMKYTMYVPVYFGGFRAGQAVVPITLESRLTEKFL